MEKGENFETFGNYKAESCEFGCMFRGVAGLFMETGILCRYGQSEEPRAMTEGRWVAVHGCRLIYWNS